MSFGAVVLAAGASRRMGRPKALLPLPSGPDEDGETFLGRIVASARAAGASAVVVVVGPPHGEAIRAAGPALRFADNPRPERGMLSSAQAGVAALPPGLFGALLWPVDIPLVRVATLRLLVADPARLAVPVQGDRGGHPLWVPEGLFPDLCALPPEAPGGLRLLRDRHPPLRVPVDDPAVLLDADTPEDLGRLRALVDRERDR